MSLKMVKWLSGSLIAMGAFIAGCSDSNSSDPIAKADEGVYRKNDVKQMWARIDERGSIASYFDSLSKEDNAPIIGVTTRSNVRCVAPALRMDENTRYLDELESLFDEGEQVDGVCGKALKLNDGQVAPLGVNLIDSMSVGTVEFWFRPNADFFDKKARTLLGNDGARIHFFYKAGELFFQKNHHNQHFFVNGKASFKTDDWNLVAGQWGDGYMSLWLNGELVGYWKHDKGYAPAQRAIPFENLVVIGYKSSCCMEGPGQKEAMTTSGSFDQFRISNITRYALPDSLTSKETPEEEKETPEEEKETPEETEKNEEVKACKASALKMDDKTLYLDELESDYESGTLVDGVCGKAISLMDGDNIQTGINLIDPMAAGTVEFWFRPSDDFDLNTARTLLGNDGARAHFFVKDGELIFQKNHAVIHYFVKGAVKLKKDWNLIAGQWGDGYMSLWVNGDMIASQKHEEGYQPSDRYANENLIVIGYKSWCCMDGPGQRSSMTTSGDFDQLRISTVPRYEVKVAEKNEKEDEEKAKSKEDLKDTVIINVPGKEDAKDTIVIDVEAPVADTAESK